MTAPVSRYLATQPYEVFVYSTRTGAVVNSLPFVGIPRWERGVNIQGSWSVVVPLDSRYITKDKLNTLVNPKWHWSLAICQGMTIYQAGPLITEEFDDGDSVTTLNGGGLWALFTEKRILVNAGRTSVGVIKNIDADVAFGNAAVSDKGGPIPAANQGVSLHTIAKRIVQNELSKPGGTLPVSLPDDIAGTAVRTYQGPELASTGQRLFELTQVASGPEIELAARFTTSDRTAVEHQMRIGNPRLGRLDYTFGWTTGKACVQLGFTSDGANMRDRDWDRGAGFDRNVITGFAENMEGVTTGSYQTRPLLETVGTLHSNSDNQTELDGYAAADLADGRNADVTLKIEVTMSGGTGNGDLPPSPPFASVSPGDTAYLRVRNHRRLPDGVYSIRITRMGPGQTAKTGVLTVQVLGGTV